MIFMGGAQVLGRGLRRDGHGWEIVATEKNHAGNHLPAPPSVE